MKPIGPHLPVHGALIPPAHESSGLLANSFHEAGAVELARGRCGQLPLMEGEHVRPDLDERAVGEGRSGDAPSPEERAVAGIQVRQEPSSVIESDGRMAPRRAPVPEIDLDPRVAIRKHILDAMEADDLAEAQAAMAAPRPGGPDLEPGERPPFDPDAT